MSKNSQYLSLFQAMKSKEHMWQKLEKGPRDNEPWTPHIPPMTYFNNHKQHGALVAYDMVFSVKEGYNQKIHRCDSHDINPIHESIFQEEKNKPVPVLTSLYYGRPCRPLLEERRTAFARVNSVKSFSSRNGTNMEPDLEDVPF